MSDLREEARPLPGLTEIQHLSYGPDDVAEGEVLGMSISVFGQVA